MCKCPWVSGLQLIVHQNKLEGLLRYTLLIQFLIQQIWCGAWEFMFLTSPHVMLLLLLVWEPYFTNHYSTCISKNVVAAAWGQEDECCQGYTDYAINQFTDIPFNLILGLP